MIRDCRASLGGGLYGVENALIEDCMFINNQAGSGGAIGINKSGTIRRCRIEGNTAVNHGGGIYCSTTGLLVEACVIRNNVTEKYDGGGVFFNFGNTIRNCLISGNRAGQVAGGLFARDGVVESCTIVGNTAAAAGGIRTAHAPAIWNSIILYNTGGVNSNFYNEANATFTGCCMAPLPATGTGNFSADPLFVDRANGNYRLMRGSPCIDRNAPIGPATLDLDGVPRPQDGDGDGVALYDPGVYEYVLPRVVNDFDYDGKTDLAVFDLAAGNWYIRTVAGAVLLKDVNWGFPGCVPVPGDYNGDGKTDLAVYHLATGDWYIWLLGGATLKVNWGFPGCLPVPADYDGDGVTDRAVYHDAAGDWYIFESSTLTWTKRNWGFAGCVPVPGDYDGDGKADRAVYWPAEGRWYIFSSATLTSVTANWGTPGLKPADVQYQINRLKGLVQ